MTEKEIKCVIGLLEKYHKIANKPDDLNNIVINGRVISIIQDGKELYKQDLDIVSIKETLDNVKFNGNVFSNSDSLYNPFEADREENSFIWREKYNNIGFPCFISVFLFTLLAFGKIPSLLEFCDIYIETYTEILKPDRCYPHRLSLYSIPCVNDRNRLGEEVVYEGKVFHNDLRRFKTKYVGYLKGFPLNEFTTEHICSRIYKTYGSFVRDIYHTLYFDSLSQRAYYNFLDDLEGIDLMLNDIPVFAYVSSKISKEFREKKIKERHPNLANIGIALEKDIGAEKNGGVYLIDNVAANKAIEISNELKRRGLQKIIRLPY